MNRSCALFASLAVLAAAPAQAAVLMKGDISPRQIYQRVGPGVVLILAVSKDGTGEMGTGSVIDDKGHIITNAHVIVQASTGRPYEVLHIYFKPTKLTGDPKIDLTDPLSAKVVSWDRGIDLALLQLEGTPARYKIVPIGDAAAVESGDPVVAIGHPEQGGLWTLTQGVVSTVIANLGGVEGKNVFQTDASINRGNSGGPLLNNQGAMIGVNTSMARKAKDGLTITSVNFSIKSDVVKDWLAKNDPELRYTVPAPAAESAPALFAPGEAPAPPAQPPAAPQTVEPPAAPQTVEPPPAPKPAVVEPPAAPQPAEATPPQAKPSQARILTEVKPFKAADLISKEISAMEDLEKDMQDEFQQRSRGL